jgi:class 3 adenylate cyclase
VAIITQHLNTPPVAPIWHRPDCPHGLEVLILRLLEKDADKRPGSAADVWQALASVSLAADVSVNDAVDVPGIPDATAMSLYQQTFVGREAELRQLQAAYDAALSGQGSLAMVVGEPGIGKTTLCEQLATYATMRGGATLVGHCYEEGSLSVPYLAFVEALRSYVLSREPETLSGALGSGAEDVARIVSEVRQRMDIEPRPSAGDPDEDRWHLLEAVMGFFRNASSVQPLVLVLEDLHWADRGTLDLLQHVARNLAGARLLIVGTYRDVEVDRSHALSGALADLRRSSAFLRIGLRGLSVDEVHRMMQQLRGQDIPWGRAEAIHRQTEGNPLFVQEVLRYIVEEGILVREGGRWVRADDGSPESGIPEGLRDVIGKRLSRLSEATNRVLAIAAVIGREFRLDVLESVAQVPPDELESALDEATRTAVLQEEARPGAIRYRFAHAFFRQTLYEELSAPRRLRLHQQVARALEGLYADRLSEHAAELAEHFAQSTDPADLAKAVEYSEIAAERARAVFAYGEAARHLEQALEVQEVLAPNDTSKRCDLLLSLGDAMLPREEPLRLIDVAIEEAFALAEALSDVQRAGRAAIIACEACYRVTGTAPAVVPAGQVPVKHRFWEWSARAQQYASAKSVESVYADVYSGVSHQQQNLPTQAFDFLRRAIHTALELDDPAAFFAAAGHAGILRTFQDHDLRRQVAEEVVARPHASIRSADLVLSLMYAGRDYLERGDRATAEACWREAGLITEHTGDKSNTIRARRASIFLAFLDGRLHEALSATEALNQQALGMGLAQGFPGLEVVLTYYLGLDTSPFLERLNPPHPLRRAHEAVILAFLGRADEARAIRRTFPDLGDESDAINEWIPERFLQVAVLTGDTETLGVLMPLLGHLAGRLSEAMFPGGVSWSYGRLLGEASVLLGNPDDARERYVQGLEVCERVRFRPELALLHLDLAELLLDHFPDEHVDAGKHLNVAISELQQMKMRPALERALRRKLQLQGVESVSLSTSIQAVSLAVVAEQPNLQRHAAPDGTVTLLFTDIEESTGLTLRLGDQRWLEVLRAHHELVRRQVQAHGGFEVKSLGDGFMLAFSSARRALDCAVAIQRAVVTGNSAHPDAPIKVRIGLHTGEALKEADDFHGKHVVLAARIANHARGGEILVSSLLRELTDTGVGIAFDLGEDVELKGMTGTQRVFRVLQG